MSALYKVLVDGRSCHGGSFAWSLPKDGAPGDWHEVERVEMCQVGFHLTDYPALWWKPGCEIFVTEAEGVVGNLEDETGKRKVVARRVRLLRLATQAELEAGGIFTSGVHEPKHLAHLPIVASGSSKVTASGSSKVTAYDSSKVTAYDSSKVTAYDSSKVTASGSSEVTAYDSSEVTASDSSKVTAYDSSKVTAYGSSEVTASGSSKVTAYDSSEVTAKDRVVVVSWRGSEAVRIDGPRVVVITYPSFWEGDGAQPMPQILTAGGLMGVLPTTPPVTPAPPAEAPPQDQAAKSEAGEEGGA